MMNDKYYIAKAE